MNNQRLIKLQRALKTPILIKKKENLFYLTGRSFDLRAEEYLLIKSIINQKKRKDTESVVGFGSGLESMSWIKKSDRLKNIGQYLKGYKQLDLEYGFTYGEGEYIKYKISDLGFKILVKPEKSPVDEMRQVKESEELAKIKKSMQIVERVFNEVKKRLRSADPRPAWTELKLAQFITSAGLRLGAEDVSFPAIVASGSNAAIPHHMPSNKKLKAGETIIIDFGFKYKNYCSDFTRTIFLKKVHPKLETAYKQVEKAYLGSMEYIGCSSPIHRPSRSLINQATTGKAITAGQVYQKAVEVLAEKKLDKYFIHSLGHGTGLEIHELPNLSPKSADVLAENMVFSIEPGVYIPKVGGVRIEDLVYLKKGSVEKFINVSTKLEDNIF